MPSGPDLRRWLRTAAVPLVCLVVLCGAFATVLHLQAQAVAARDAQAKLLSLRLDLMQLRDVPWDAQPGSGVTPVEARGELRDALASIDDQFASLERSPGLPNRRAILGHVSAATAALWQLYRAVRTGNSDATNTASDAAATQIYAANDAMRSAASAYHARSDRSRREAILGTVLVLAVLFAGFAWFYVRAALRRGRSERLVATLRAAEADRAELLHAVVDAAEDERLRIAADLHDGPIQQLSGLALVLDLAAGRIARGEVNAVPGAIQSARGITEQQIVALRRLMMELRPSALVEAGITAALRDYVGAFAERTEIESRFESTLGGRRYDEAVETTLYRVAQEALANVEKHAGAGRVDVSLAEDGEVLELRVEDDGRGFAARSESALLRAHHFGLVGVRERLERSGGSWRVESALGRGTVVTARIPAVAAAAA
jgi:signal transduction histidine kinase